MATEPFRLGAGDTPDVGVRLIAGITTAVRSQTSIARIGEALSKSEYDAVAVITSERGTQEVAAQIRQLPIAVFVSPALHWTPGAPPPFDGAYPKGWIADKARLTVESSGHEDADAIILHKWDPIWEVGALGEEIDRLRTEGVTGCVGLSLPDSATHVIEHGSIDLVCSSWNIHDQDSAECLAAARRKGLRVLGRAPFDHGILTRERAFPSGDWRHGWLGEHAVEATDRARRLADYARNHGLTAAELAFRWTLRQGWPTDILVGISVDAVPYPLREWIEKGPLHQDILSDLLRYGWSTRYGLHIK
jgi:aryl-alcohol dehydrogenase-like predicted oxidoreductase